MQQWPTGDKMELFLWVWQLCTTGLRNEAAGDKTATAEESWLFWMSWLRRTDTHTYTEWEKDMELRRSLLWCILTGRWHTCRPHYTSPETCVISLCCPKYNFEAWQYMYNHFAVVKVLWILHVSTGRGQTITQLPLWTHLIPSVSPVNTGVAHRPMCVCSLR